MGVEHKTASLKSMHALSPSLGHAEWVVWKASSFSQLVAPTLMLAGLWLAMITFDYGSPALEQFAEIVVRAGQPFITKLLLSFWGKHPR